MTYLIDQLLNGISIGSVYALIALGFAMVYGVLKFLNFAHSEVFTFGAYLAYFTFHSLHPYLGDRPITLLLIAMGAAAIGAGTLAVAVERIAYRPLREQPAITVLLTAIGVSIVLQNLGLQALTAHTRGFPVLDLPTSPQQTALIILLLSFGLLHVLIYHSSIGIQMRAVAEDPEVAKLMGFDPDRVIIFVFFVGGFFAGIAGVTWGLVYGTVHPQMGFLPGLKSFIIAVVGSAGSLTGTFLIGLSLGIAEALVAGFLPSELSAFRDAIVFILLTAAIVWKPQGIFGNSVPEKV